MQTNRCSKLIEMKIDTATFLRGGGDGNEKNAQNAAEAPDPPPETELIPILFTSWVLMCVFLLVALFLQLSDVSFEGKIVCFALGMFFLVLTLIEFFSHEWISKYVSRIFARHQANSAST